MRFILKLLIILLLIIVIGAVIFYFYSTVVEPETQPSPEPTTNLPPAAPTEEEACKATGGRWEKRGRLEKFWCIHNYPDGGKPCSSSDECESKRCLTKSYNDSTSYCDYADYPPNCYTTIEQFKAGLPGICAH